MLHLIAEPLEDRAQPALFALNLPGLSVLIATEVPVASQVVVGRMMDVFLGFSGRTGDASNPAAPAPAEPGPTPTPTPTTPSTSVPDASSGGIAIPIAEADVAESVPAASAMAQPLILLPPGERTLATEGATAQQSFAASPAAGALPLLPEESVAVNPLFAVPSSFAAVMLLEGSTAVAPLPREGGAIPPMLVPEAESAPAPREATDSEPRETVFVLPAGSFGPGGPAVEVVAEPLPEAESTWGWLGAASAILIAGGYWMMRTLRLRRPATSLRAASKRLPFGTILSTDLQPA